MEKSPREFWLEGWQLKPGKIPSIIWLFILLLLLLLFLVINFFRYLRAYSVGFSRWRIVDGSGMSYAKTIQDAKRIWGRREKPLLLIYAPVGGIFRRARLIGAAEGWTIECQRLSYNDFFLIDKDGGRLPLEICRFRAEGGSCDCTNVSFNLEKLLRSQTIVHYLSELRDELWNKERERYAEQQQREKVEGQRDFAKDNLRRHKEGTANTYALLAAWLRACKRRTLKDTRAIIVRARDIAERNLGYEMDDETARDALLEGARRNVEAAKALEKERAARAS